MKSRQRAAETGETEVPPNDSRQPAMDNLTGLAIGELAGRCAEELQGLGTRADANGVYGLELLRRAVVEEASDAAAVARELYAPLVQRWIAQHQRFSEAGEEVETIVHVSFQNFFAGANGVSFARFGTFASALSYLKMCVHAAITGHIREQQQAQIGQVMGGYELAVLPRQCSETRELWRHICRVLPDSRDQLLARCVYALGMKPGEIAAAYSDYWSSAQEVAQDLARIRQALYDAPGLAGQQRRRG